MLLESQLGGALVGEPGHGIGSECENHIPKISFFFEILFTVNWRGHLDLSSFADWYVHYRCWDLMFVVSTILCDLWFWHVPSTLIVHHTNGMNHVLRFHGEIGPPWLWLKHLLIEHLYEPIED
jgi:hypothetical protein